MTTPAIPDDELAINIGKLYVDINNKMKDELDANLKVVLAAQKQKDLDELVQLKKEAEDKKQEADTAQKQVDQKIDELKRKYGSIDN